MAAQGEAADGDPGGGSQVEAPASVEMAPEEEPSATFCTGVDLTTQKREAAFEKVRPDGPRVIRHHEEFQNLARTMDERFGLKLAEHKKEFFLAYKTHMYTVQADMRAMKIKANIEEAKLKEDAKISHLEVTLGRFMGEALRLDELCEGYKKEVDKWRTQVSAMEEDRAIIEQQVKGTKRQNKVLRAAAERARAAANSAMMLTNGPATPAPRGRPSCEVASPLQRTLRGSASAPAGRLLQSPASSPQPRVMALPPLRGSRSDTSLAASAAAWQQEAATRTLKSAILREQRDMREVKAARAAREMQKGELEELFLQCMDEAKKDLGRTAHRIAEAKKGQKERILEALLRNDEVMVSLYEQIFPNRNEVARSFGSCDRDRVVVSPNPLSFQELDLGTRPTTVQ